MTKPDDPAFPDANLTTNTGLTLREYFAALALQGLLAAFTDDQPLPSDGRAARMAVEYADALIEALNAPKPDLTA